MLERILRVIIRIANAIELMVDDMTASDIRQTSLYQLVNGDTRGPDEARVETWADTQC
jgi:hypothetical protein